MHQQASQQDLGIEAMAHFTCVGATVDELRATLSEIEAAGVENVLALRGDPPRGETVWTQTEGGLRYSTQLIGLLREHFDFAVGAAAFPEVHTEAEAPRPTSASSVRVRRRRRGSSARSRSRRCSASRATSRRWPGSRCAGASSTST